MAPRLSREEPDEEVVEVRLAGRSWLPFWWREAETGILASLPGEGVPGRFWAGQTKGQTSGILAETESKRVAASGVGGQNQEMGNHCLMDTEFVAQD